MITCITGMHRSGTSMTARLLNLCGIDLGDEKDLISAAEDNPEGFWEHAKFQAINEEILSIFGGSWDSPPLLEGGWETDSRLADTRVRAISLIGSFSENHIRGWKDPRNSLTLPFWKTLIPNLKVIVCLRNPFEVYRSLTRRSYASSVFSYRLWLTYYQHIIAITEPENRIVTHFDSYFYDARSEIRRLVDYLGMDVSDDVIENACKAASIGLRHHYGSISDLVETNAPQQVVDIYKDLCSQAGSVYYLSLSPSDRASLGTVLLDNSEDLPPLQDPQQVLDLTEILGKRDKQIYELNESLEQRNGKIHELNESLEQRNGKIHKLNESLGQRNEEIHELVETVERLNADVERLNADIEGLRYSVTSLQSEIKHIFDSRSWRVISFFQKTRTLFVPLGSKRERFFRWIFFGNSKVHKIPSVLQREGFKGLFFRVRNRANINKLVSVSPETTMTIYDELVSSAVGKQGDEFVDLSDDDLSDDESLLKLIAFYLPQFHPIAENDKWWGKGFTEWRNVSKAVPQFIEHYQPRLPGELGFYDLRVPEIQKRQIELARKYGIHGFAFHYYWFNGKRLLEKPLDLFLESKENFPFCICWANENWTRRWDGQEDDILIAQQHSLESDRRFIEDISSILRDKRYIRINGRPVLIVYRANILPNVMETVALWRKYCQEHGIGDPYLVAAQTFWFEDPREVGFDAAVEFPPHNVATTDIRHTVQVSNPNYKGNIINYKEMIELKSSDVHPEYQLFKTVFPSWDNEARKPGRGYTFAFSTPILYKNWLLQAAKFTLQEKDPEKRLLFINAWNEWGEGAYLEPDRKYGYAYLQATADALKELSHKYQAIKTQ